MGVLHHAVVEMHDVCSAVLVDTNDFDVREGVLFTSSATTQRDGEKQYNGDEDEYVLHRNLPSFW